MNRLERTELILGETMRQTKIEREHILIGLRRVRILLRCRYIDRPAVDAGEQTVDLLLLLYLGHVLLDDELAEINVLDLARLQIRIQFFQDLLPERLFELRNR